MTTPQTVIGTWMLSVAAQFERLGLSLDLLEPALGASAHTAPTRQLQLVQVRGLWQRAAAVSADPRPGLRIGAGLPLQAMNVLTLVVMHSACPRDALGRCVRYQQARLQTKARRMRETGLSGGAVRSADLHAV